MIVLKIDLLGAFAGPTEGNAVVPAYAHGPSLGSAAQAVESIPCHVHVLRPGRHFQQLQDTDALSKILRADPPCLTREIEFLEALVSETGDHVSSVN